MDKKVDINDIKKALTHYIKANGYTKFSFAQKCNIESELFKLFLNQKLSMKKDLEEAILHIVLTEEKITLAELMSYTDK